MTDIDVVIIDNGPLKVSGGVSLVDGATGAQIPGGDASPIFLCRCGGSSNKPFCDGTHKRNGFDGAMPCVVAEPPADA